MTGRLINELAARYRLRDPVDPVRARAQSHHREALGLTIPDKLLALADEAIE